MRYWEHSYYLGNLERVLNDLRLKLHKVSVKQTIGKTDEEISLVCKTEEVPENIVERDDGWKGFRMQTTFW